MATTVIPETEQAMRPGRFGAYGGRYVPETLMAALEELEHAGPEGEAAKGVEIAARTIGQLRNICNGVHVMAIGWEERIPEILSAAGVSLKESDPSGPPANGR